jgi:hypothetical protein
MCSARSHHDCIACASSRQRRNVIETEVSLRVGRGLLESEEVTAAALQIDNYRSSNRYAAWINYAASNRRRRPRRW